MDCSELEEFDLSPIIAHNAGLHTSIGCISSAASSHLEELPVLQHKPISKRRGKKRSSRACASCRARKVRCNIVAHGAPCSNCRHDEVACILPMSRRQKAAKERAEQQDAQMGMQRSLSVELAESQGSDGISFECAEHPSSRQPEKISPHLSPPHGMSISEYELCEIMPAQSASQRNSPVPDQQPIWPVSEAKSKRNSRLSRRTIEAPLATSIYVNSAKLPKPFLSLPSHLSTTDIAYLTARSAFDLPSQALQVALLQVFVEFVHPSLPITDIEEILDTLKTGKGKRISLLLFQTMMLSGMEYVSGRILKAEYSGRSKAEVMTTMIERVKLLYDFDTTTERLTIVQSMLLFSHALSNSRSTTNMYDLHKDSYHYLGLALSLSFSLGIHRKGPPIPKGFPHGVPVTSAMASMYLSSIRRKKLEKRIWWSLCVQDQFLDIGGSGSRRIYPGDHDVAMLSLEDFDGYDDGMEEDDEDQERPVRQMQAKTFMEKVLLYQWATQAMATGHLHTADGTLLQQNLRGGSTTFSGSDEVASPSSHSPPYTYATSNTTSEDMDMERDCLTPQDDHCLADVAIDPIATQKYVDEVQQDKGRGAEVEFGYGVAGEYDDYLEYI